MQLYQWCVACPGVGGLLRALSSTGGLVFFVVGEKKCRTGQTGNRSRGLVAGRWLRLASLDKNQNQIGPEAGDPSAKRAKQAGPYRTGREACDKAWYLEMYLVATCRSSLV